MRMKLQRTHFNENTGGIVVVLITIFVLNGYYCTSEHQHRREDRNASTPPPYYVMSSPPPHYSSSPPYYTSSPPPQHSSSPPPQHSSSPPPYYSSPLPPPHHSSSPSYSSPPPPYYSSPSPPPYSSSPPPYYSSSPPPYASSPSPTLASSLCINKLFPCLNYISDNDNTNRNNGDDKHPSDSCCDPLKSMIKSNPECFCNMISIKGNKEAEKAGINVTRAQQLPNRCGQRVNPISCLTSTGYPGSKNTQPSSASTFPFSSQNFAEVFTLLMIFQSILAGF